jgi:hypothetical protein
VDDLRVRISTLANVLKQPAYLLFYEKLSKTDAAAISFCSETSYVSATAPLSNDVDKRLEMVDIPSHNPEQTSEYIPSAEDIPNEDAVKVNHQAQPTLPLYSTIPSSTQETAEKIPSSHILPANTVAPSAHQEQLNQDNEGDIARLRSQHNYKRMMNAIYTSNDISYSNETGWWEDEFTNQNPTISVDSTNNTEPTVLKKRSIREATKDEEGSSAHQPSAKKQKRQVSTILKRPWKWIVSFGKLFRAPTFFEDDKVQQPTTTTTTAHEEHGIPQTAARRTMLEVKPVQRTAASSSGTADKLSVTKPFQVSSVQILFDLV